MQILIVNNTRIPALHYGGTERVIWALGKELACLGHHVTYLVAPGSECPFADIQAFDPDRPLEDQISDRFDVVHIHFPIPAPLPRPYLLTIHGNGRDGEVFPPNTVFLTADHARRHGGAVHVYNGLDFDEYGDPDWSLERTHALFLAKASRREKNLRGALRIARRAGEKLYVAGGNGFSLSPGLVYCGFVGGERKNRVLNGSKCLLAPVLWDEPFGLFLAEALWFGVPVIGTPFGSLPELVPADVGCLSDSLEVLADAVRDIRRFDRKRCHEYCREAFPAHRMAKGYLRLYERVLDGEVLNKENCRTQEGTAGRRYGLRP